MSLQKEQLGNTDLFVSQLGLGTVKFGRNTDVKYPHSFSIPSDNEAANLIAYAKDLGINVLDTAPAYGNSEERLGKLLAGQRHDWIIVGKAGEEYHNQKSTYNFTREHIFASIKRSLTNLQTDVIDILLIHSDGNDEYIINNFDVFNTLEDAKQQGLIRYSGMSTKTVEGGLLTLKYADTVMCMYNPIAAEEKPVLDAAAHLNKGAFIKKAFASGHLAKITGDNPVQASLDFIFDHPGVGNVILGTIDPKHLLQNVACAKRSLSTAASTG